jgi:trimeric autotransporter adhesin
MADITLLPSAKVPLIYDGELTMTTEWYRFFWNIYGFTGTGVVPVDRGGTGLNTIGDHQVIIGNANNVFEPAVFTGTGINISYAPGIINLAIGASGVTPGTYGSASQVGVFTVNQFGNITAASNTSIGINASQIVSGIIASARISGSYTGITGVGVLTAGTWNADTIGTIYGGTGLTSFVSGGALYATSTTALTSGTLPVTAGGTGQTSFTNGQLLIGNTTGNTLTKATLTAGSGVTITNGAGSITISATGTGGTVTAVTGVAPIASSGGTTPAISISQSNTTTDGYLSATDWNTFNNKQPAGTYVTSISIASSNGFTGTSSGGATPSLTLATSVTGILKGNGTAISAATSGADYAPATSGTSILYGNGAGGFSNVTIGTGVSFAGGTLSATGSGGTVTSVAALTLGTTGTDLSSTVANSTTTPVITLNVPTASAVNRGALSAADWTTFNSKVSSQWVTSGSNIYYTTGNVGIGTTNPTTELTLSANTALPSAGAPAGVNLWQVGADSTANTFHLDSFNSLTRVVGRRSGGTSAAPSAISSGNLNILVVSASGYGATGYFENRAALSFLSSETWTDTAQGTQIRFSTTAIGSTSTLERMRISDNGDVGIGTTLPNAILHVSKASTSTTIGGSTAIVKVVNSQASGLNENAGIEFFSRSTGGSDKLAGVYGVYTDFNATGYGGALVFATEAPGATNVTERARFTSAGDLGIGTTSPQNGAGYGGLTLNGSNGGQLSFFTGGTLRSTIFNDATNLYLYNAVAGSAIISTNATERMRVHSTGGVSIGNTTDPGAGALRISGSLVNQGAYSSTYHLDTTPSSIVLATGGTVNISNFSGMVMVNNTATGGSQVFLAGGGATTSIGSNGAGGGGTLTYNAGIGGYTFTSTYVATASFGFVIIRTRTTA